MKKEELCFENGFDKNSFMQYMDDNFRMHSFGRNTVDSIVDYALKHENVSLDQAVYFISDIVPEVEFKEVAAFTSDEMLTMYGKNEKSRFWMQKEEEAKAIAEAGADVA